MINKHIGDAAMKMRRKKLLGAGLILLILCLLGFQTQSPAEWQRPTQPSLAGNALTCLAAHPLDASKFLVASKQQVFEGGDEPGWKSLWCRAMGMRRSSGSFLFPFYRMLCSRSQHVMFLWET